MHVFVFLGIYIGINFVLRWWWSPRDHMRRHFSEVAIRTPRLHPKWLVLDMEGTERIRVHTLQSCLEDGKPWMLLTHGIHSTSLNLAEIAEECAKTHNVVVVDLPGWGVTDKLGDYTRMNEFFRGLLNQLGAEECDWVAHSLSTYYAVQFAHEYPKRIGRLYLVSPVGLFPLTKWDAVFQAVVIRNALLHMFCRWNYGWLHVMCRKRAFLIRHSVTQMALPLPNKYIMCQYIAWNRWKEPCLHKLLGLQTTHKPVLVFGKHDPIVNVHKDIRILNNWVKCILLDASHAPHRRIQEFIKVLKTEREEWQPIEVRELEEMLSEFRGSWNPLISKRRVLDMYHKIERILCVANNKDTNF